jgi:hypothetical protein
MPASPNRDAPATSRDGATARTGANAGAGASGLDVELALLRDAHTALRDGDGAGALALLREHARRFPAGALSEERDAARVLALCKVGRVAEARDVASRFLREHPRSPQASRVARACDGDDD